MLALKYITDDVTMLMDMTKFDESDDSVLMWHCGPAAARFGKTYCLGCNYSGKAHIEGQPPLGIGVARDMVFDPMPAPRRKRRQSGSDGKIKRSIIK